MFVLCFVLFVHAAIAEKSHHALIVHTSSGVLRGHVIENAVSAEELIYAFQGIPFAKPPIGKLRFQPPIPPEPWTGVRNATKDGPSCVRNDGGSEDCLVLNVFTPELPPECITLKPVLVFVHGGGFVFGAGFTKDTRPDYFLTEDVVLVVIQYRLGAFGFLNTLDESAPGNAGLKDQVAALQWVKENIANFGGDPKLVTVFGQSSGGSSVQMLLMSPLAKGLFHRAISESGSVLNRWSLIRENTRDLAFKLGRSLGIKTNNTKKLVEELQKVDARRLFNESVMAGEFHPLAAPPFVPSREFPHPGAFMAASSNYQELEEGQYDQTVPYMMGYNTAEGSYSIWSINSGELNYNTYINNHEELVPEAMNLEKGSNISKTVAEEIVSFFFPNATIDNEEKFVNYMSDDLIVRGVRKSVEIMKNFGDVYFYMYTYKRSYEQGSVPAVGHDSELPNLFYDGDFKNEQDKLVSQRMIKLWTNFAKYGNPTPTKDPLLNDVIWPKANDVMTSDTTAFLNISAELISDINPEQDKYNFWETLFAKYGNPPYYIY